MVNPNSSVIGYDLGRAPAIKRQHLEIVVEAALAERGIDGQ